MMISEEFQVPFRNILDGDVFRWGSSLYMKVFIEGSKVNSVTLLGGIGEGVFEGPVLVIPVPGKFVPLQVKPLPLPPIEKWKKSHIRSGGISIIQMVVDICYEAEGPLHLSKVVGFVRDKLPGARKGSITTALSRAVQRGDLSRYGPGIYGKRKEGEE